MSKNSNIRFVSTAGKRQHNEEKPVLTGEKKPALSARKKAANRKILLIAAGIAGAALLCLALVYKLTIKPPDITQPPADPAAVNVDGSAPETAGIGRKPDFYTILLVGLDKVGANTDVIMAASFDVKNKKIDVINIPRDTMVNVKRSVKKINAAYSAGGIDNLLTEVSTLIGFKPDMYAMVDLKGFVKLVDAVGGVDFDVPIDMNYDDPEQDLHIHFEKGLQHLDGQEALEVVRFRHNSNGSGYPNQDLGRIETTQKLLGALSSKLLKPSMLLKLNSLSSILQEALDTDMKSGEMLWFMQQALSVDSENDVNFHTLSEKSGMYKHLSYVFVDEQEALTLINSTINPYTQDLTDLDILDTKTGSSSGSSGSSSTKKKPSATAKPSSAPSSAPAASATPTPVETPTTAPESSSEPEQTEPPEQTEAPVSPPDDGSDIVVTPIETPFVEPYDPPEDTQ